MKPLVGWFALALVAAPVGAGAEEREPAPKQKVTPGKGFWKILVKPKAKWVLRADDRKTDVITVETYDVRKVGDADVARLRWTYTSGKDKEDIGDTDAGKPTQVAVTAKGLYLLNASNDDARIVERLKGKPSRSDPPKAYDGTKQNQGRYLAINDQNGAVCMGYGPPPGSGECADVCDGWICVSATAGVTEIAGLMAPGYRSFMQ